MGKIDQNELLACFMNRNRILAAGFIFIVLVSAIVAVSLTLARKQQPLSPALVTSALPTGTKISSQEDQELLSFRVSLNKNFYAPGETAEITSEFANYTNRTIVVKFPSACTEPSLASDGSVLIAPERVCAQSTTFIIFKPRQSYQVVQPIYLRHPQGAITAQNGNVNQDFLPGPSLDSHILFLRSGVNSYLLQLAWQGKSVTMSIILSSTP